MRIWVLVGLGGALALGAGLAIWHWTHPGLPDGIVVANGRLEAERVQIAAKYAGRVADVLVEEGDLVKAGDVLARMDTKETTTQLQQAEAQADVAGQQEGEAAAAVDERKASLVLAQRQYTRARDLHKSGYASSAQLDQARASMDSADAGLKAAQATLRQAIAGIDAANAQVAQIRTVLDDSVLTAPRSGRIQYKLIQQGEVVGAGTTILTLLDLSDVYMTVFLPAADAGTLAIGGEAHLVLDPAPQYVVPAKITFVAADAQFTPKSVETSDEREKLMFRVKLTISPALLEHYEARVKTGVRGLAYVRTKPDVAWPADLAVRLPDLRAGKADVGE